VKRLVASLFATLLVLVFVAPAPVEAGCAPWCTPRCHTLCKEYFCYSLTGTVERVAEDSVALRIDSLTLDDGTRVHTELTGALVHIFNDGDYANKVGERVESDGHFLDKDGVGVLAINANDDGVSVMLHPPRETPDQTAAR
jgi:hypothetical protein